MYKRTLRPAIAMIELIFALVIMGIVLMSAPQLISTATKSGYVAIQQEAINEAASHVNMIMGSHWDESNTNEEFLDPVLHANNTSSTDLNISDNNRTRIGTPIESYRSYIRSDGVYDLNATTILGFDASESGKGDEDDIDDYNGETYNLDPVETSSADYIEKNTDINISTVIRYSKDDTGASGGGGYNTSGTITYIPFRPETSGTTNIKSITVTLVSSSTNVSELQKEITLRAFSCNIGGYKLEERDF